MPLRLWKFEGRDSSTGPTWVRNSLWISRDLNQRGLQEWNCRPPNEGQQCEGVQNDEEERGFFVFIPRRGAGARVVVRGFDPGQERGFAGMQGLVQSRGLEPPEGLHWKLLFRLAGDLGEALPQDNRHNPQGEATLLRFQPRASSLGGGYSLLAPGHAWGLSMAPGAEA